MLLGLCGVAIADNVTVYRWVDKNNVVHFSQHQPTHNNYTELTLSNVVKVKKKIEEKAQIKSENQTALNITGSTERCEEAKANVRTLEAYDKIQYTDAQGQVQVLSPLEKQQQLEINKKQIEVYCK